jgi:hypothetical protein
MLVVFLYTLLRVFAYLPTVVLAAVVLASTRPLLAPGDARALWRCKKTDALQLLVTFFCVLGLGIASGLVVGLAFLPLLGSFGGVEMLLSAGTMTDDQAARSAATAAATSAAVAGAATSLPDSSFGLF